MFPEPAQLGVGEQHRRQAARGGGNGVGVLGVEPRALEHRPQVQVRAGVQLSPLAVEKHDGLPLSRDGHGGYSRRLGSGVLERCPDRRIQVGPQRRRVELSGQVRGVRGRGVSPRAGGRTRHAPGLVEHQAARRARARVNHHHRAVSHCAHVSPTLRGSPGSAGAHCPSSAADRRPSPANAAPRSRR